MTRTEYNRKLQSRLLQVWAKFCVQHPTLESYAVPVVKIDGRVKRGIAYFYPTTNIIRVSWFWAQRDRNQVILREVVAHEVAHYVDELLYGLDATEIDDGHGPTWRDLMVQYGLKPNTHYNLF